MRRVARKLCGVGLVAFISACIVLYIFDHIPAPWGTGTLPGGMSDVGAESSIDRAMQWQLEVMGLTLGVGFSGALCLFAGGATWLVSWLRPGAGRTAESTRQLP